MNRSTISAMPLFDELRCRAIDGRVMNYGMD